MQEWIFLRNRRPKLVKLGHFRSINKNYQNLKFFEVGSLPNSTQGIFDIIQKIICALFLPLQTILEFNFAHFRSINKNFQNLKFFEVGSLPNSTQVIFDIIQKKFCRSISAAPDDFRVQFCPFQVY